MKQSQNSPIKSLQDLEKIAMLAGQKTMERLTQKYQQKLDETKSTENFVVPNYLKAGVAELKEGYPDASEERLADILKYF